MIRDRKRQSGMVLLVAMIMLIMMTLMAISTFNLGRNSMQIIGNMQQSQEAANAANAVIQEVMSTTRMFQSPNNIFLAPCAGVNTRCFDTNGDGTNDITVTLNPAPTCVQSVEVPDAVLDWANPNDQGCIVQETGEFGVQGAGVGSLCAQSVWEVRAEAEDAVTGAQVVVTQGAAVRVGINQIAMFCP